MPSPIHHDFASLQPPTASASNLRRPRSRSHLTPLVPSLPRPHPPRTPQRSNTRYSPPSPLPFPSLVSPPDSHLPFHFGAEFEVIVRLKNSADFSQTTGPTPDADSSVSQQRRFRIALIKALARRMTDSGFACNAVIPGDDDEDEKPDYSKWHVTIDPSVSTSFQKDGYYGMEVVMPVTTADETWPQLLDNFWNFMHRHFDLLQDASCGFHVHVSPSPAKRYSLDQLRQVAKAVVLWEKQTARCAPLSRQDQVLAFCKSNVEFVDWDKPSRLRPFDVARMLHDVGPWRGTRIAFEWIEDSVRTRDEIVDFVCSDKNRAWNFKPSKDSGHGTIEFRRAPGVTSSKASKHWIAFTMAFIGIAFRFNASAELYNQYLDFETQLLLVAERLGIRSELDGLRQVDNPGTLHVSSMTDKAVSWLQRRDSAYGSLDDR